MQQPEMSYFEWTQRFSTREACLEEIARHRWPQGFLCPRCGHDHAHVLARDAKRQCARCRYQVSVTAGTLFHKTHIPLPKWFAAIYLMSADKGGISALRLSKLLGVSWPSAYRMLRLLRLAMRDRDRCYPLSGLIEVDDAFVGGKRPGKRGRGAQGKTPVLFAVEQRGAAAGYLAATVLPEGVTQTPVSAFARRHLAPGSTLRTDALPALRSLGRSHAHQARVTPPEEAGEWLPKVHLVIANFKRFLLGTFHGVSPRYLGEYLDEFVYRFNRRHWEAQLPQRLLETAVSHVPIPMRAAVS